MMFIKKVFSTATAFKTQRRKRNETLIAKRIAKNSNYSFTVDYTSWLTPVWEQYLTEFKGKENINFLEIGCFEGRSSIWFLENILTHPTSLIICVDNFSRPGGEPRFDHNIRISGFSNKVTKIRSKSEAALTTLREESFDIIYIDGCKNPLNVLMDAVSSWLLLNPGE